MYSVKDTYGTEESVRHGKCSTGKLVDNFGISGAVRLGFVGQHLCRSLSLSITLLHIIRIIYLYVLPIAKYSMFG